MPRNVKKTAGVSKNDWETPPGLGKKIRETFGITLDVCATAETAQAQNYFGPPGEPLGNAQSGARPETPGSDISIRRFVRCIGNDGLVQSWAGHRWYMNPPYSGGQIDAWLAKAEYEALTRGTSFGVVLLPNSSDSKWWRRYVHKKAVVLPIHGRLKFVGAPSGAMFASVLALYIPDFHATRGDVQ